MGTGDKLYRMRHPTPAFDLELRQLRTLVALVDNGSVTAASQALHVAQSTVSEAIAALERALGTPLIHHRRGPHPTKLTVAGEVLLPRAREALTIIDKACISVARAVVNTRGSIQIIANESVSTYVLSPVLATMRAKWPKMKFSVSVGTCDDVRESVRNGSFDLGLLLEVIDRKPRSAATSRTHSKSKHTIAPLVPLVLFAAPTHPLAKSSGRTATAKSALNPFPLFLSDAAGDFHALIDRFIREDRLPGARIESAGSIEGVKTAVLVDAQALGILPGYAVAEELKTRRVARVNIRPEPPQMRLVGATSGLGALHPSAADLLQEMIAFCAKHL